MSNDIEARKESFKIMDQTISACKEEMRKDGTSLREVQAEIRKLSESLKDCKERMRSASKHLKRPFVSKQRKEEYRAKISNLEKAEKELSDSIVVLREKESALEKTLSENGNRIRRVYRETVNLSEEES